jgi:hypothetical protein
MDSYLTRIACVSVADAPHAADHSSRSQTESSRSHFDPCPSSAMHRSRRRMVRSGTADSQHIPDVPRFSTVRPESMRLRVMVLCEHGSPP